MSTENQDIKLREESVRLREENIKLREKSNGSNSSQPEKYYMWKQNELGQWYQHAEIQFGK